MPFRIIVVFIGAIGSAITAVVYPYLGLLMMVFLNFGRPQDDRPNLEPLHIPMMITIAVLVGTLARFGSTGRPLVAGVKRLWIVFVLFALMCVSALNHWTELSKYRLDEFSTLLAFCVLTLGLVTTEKRLRSYMIMVLASGAYNILRAVRNPSHIEERIGYEHFERMSIAKGNTVFGNSNYLALFMVITIAVGLTLMGYYRAFWQRVLLLMLVGGAGYVFFRANSRGASIALAVVMLFLWLLQKRKLKAAVIGVVIISIVALAAPSSYWDRLSTVTRYEQDQSATSRLELWDIALQLISEHPVLGVGPDNFSLHAPNTPHNAYLQMASEVGLPALLVYIVCLVTGLYSAWSAYRLSLRPGGNAYIRAASQGAFCCVLAVMIQGFTTGLAHRELVYVSVTICYCMQGFAARAQAETPKQDLKSHDALFEVASPTAGV